MRLDLTVVPAGTNSKHFTDNEEMLHHYREWYSINFISDNYDKKSTEGYGLLERIAVSKMWIGSFDTAFKRKSWHLKSKENFSVLCKKTLNLRKQQRMIDKFSMFIYFNLKRSFKLWWYHTRDSLCITDTIDHRRIWPVELLNQWVT